MRILFLSNFYPPNFIGGYEIGCSRVVHALKSRGHECHVLTSDLGGTASCDEATRSLRFWLKGRSPEKWGGIKTFYSDCANRNTARKVIRRFSPDLVYVWNPMLVYPGSLLGILEAKRPISFYVSDLWPIHWLTDADSCFQRLKHAQKNVAIRSLHRLFSGSSLAAVIKKPSIMHAQFASNFLLNACNSVLPGEGRFSVVPWGVPLEDYSIQRTWSRGACRFLYAGQLSEHKGTHTAIEAFCIARSNSHHQSNLHLNIAGNAHSATYETQLHNLVEAYGAKNSVTFLGKVGGSELAQLYKSSDAFLFPSAWEEPFSIALVEAMASGLAVITTMTGGTGELVSVGTNALCFPVGDAHCCANLIIDTMSDPALCSRLSENAVQSTQALSMRSMVDKIERELIDALQKQLA